MSLFGPISRAAYDDDEEEESKNSGGSAIGGFIGKLFGIIILCAFALLLIPAVILVGLFHLLLSRARLRVSVIALFTLILTAAGLIVWNVTESGDRFVYFFTHLEAIQENFSTLIPPFIAINLILGSIVGLVVVAWSAHTLKSTPHLREVENSWTYKFKYRRTPWEYFKLRRRKRALRVKDLNSEKRAPLGVNLDDDEINYRYYAEANKQTLVTGGVGSGKTFSILSMILSDIKNHVAVIAVDFKRDPAFAARLAYWAAKYGRDFYHFTSGDPEDYDIPTNKHGQSQYDPLHDGSPAVRADMVLGMREYDSSSAVYKSNMQQLLQVLFSAIDQADRSKAKNIDWDSGGINQIASCIEGDNLTDLAAACEGKRVEKDIAAIRDASHGRTQIKHALEELQGQMRTLTASQYGRWMRTGASERNINLFDLTSDADNPPVILFSIDSDAEQDFSRYLGSLIMADITNVSAMRRNARLENQVAVYVDEFQAVPPSAVKSLLEKSRASKLAMTLSVQSFEQIVQAADSNGEATLNGILDTCGNFLVHAGAIEPSAERLAEIQGQDEFTTYKTSGKHENFLFNINWANRRNQIVQTGKEWRWITPPRDFMNLSSPSESNHWTATAMFLTKTIEDKRYKSTGAVARRLQIIPNNEVFNENLFDVDEAQESEPDNETVTSNEVIESEIVEPKGADEPDVSDDFEQPDEDDAPQPTRAPKKAPRKTVIENSVGPDPEWTEEDPNDGDSDFKWADKEADVKSREKTPDELEAEFRSELPTFNDQDLFVAESFKPESLREKETKSKPQKEEAKSDDETPILKPGQLPPLE